MAHFNSGSASVRWPPQTFRWIDREEPVTIVFTRGEETIYSGDCRIIRQNRGQKERQLILEPVKHQMRRFRPREFRSKRHRLVPSPDVIFNHPLFSSPINLKIYDISGAGFSVEEEKHTAALLPGMIIPDLDIIFSNGSVLRCIAQVVYNRSQPDSATVRCGLAILDMAVEVHFRLLALLHQAGDANIYICNKVDMQALWDFFFETGFIYPEKYKFIEANKEKIKSTYEKLYNQNSGIATHFIYQDNGHILAHMAMVRFYDKAWLIHHHAAIRNEYQMAGLVVLNQVAQFINNCHRLHSMNMDFAFCYFRPDNKFPAHVFGGAVRHINNSKICSIDQLAYYYHNKQAETAATLPNRWQLAPISEEDLRDLTNFYDKQSDGLMLEGLHLQTGRIQCDDVKTAYGRNGLKRERQVYALRYKERLCAVFMANHADLGLNMSDLTNSITIIVANPNHLTKTLLQTATNIMAELYEQEKVPVLLFPKQVATQLELNSEKSYCLWIYHTQNLDPYFRYLKRFLKFARH